MASEMFAVFQIETDNVTYSFEHLIGIFESQELAETALLTHVEDLNVLNAKIWELDKEQSALIKIWNESFESLRKKLVKGGELRKRIDKDEKYKKSINDEIESEKAILSEKLKIISNKKSELTKNTYGLVSMGASLDDYQIRPIEVGKISRIS